MLVGIETSDDAGVFQVSDTLALVETVDIITPMVDDPYAFGQIAAANAISDVYAMGGQPLTALNICCFPAHTAELDVLRSIVLGGLDKIREAGAVLIGGHTVRDDELKYGLAVSGIAHPKSFVSNAGAQWTDRLVLTKPIGTGVLINAFRKGKLVGAAFDRAVRQMTTLNDRACAAMLEAGVHACTDVSGFGLAGHAMEMARASRVRLRVNVDDVPHYDEALDLLSSVQGTRSRETTADYCCEPDITPAREALLFDPQTSGGLLISVARTQADRLIERLHEAGITDACIIGEVFDLGPPGLEIGRGQS